MADVRRPLWKWWLEQLRFSEMGNLATAQVNTAQLQGCSRELDLSRGLTYEQYQEVGLLCL